MEKEELVTDKCTNKFLTNFHTKDNADILKKQLFLYKLHHTEAKFCWFLNQDYF